MHPRTATAHSGVVCSLSFSAIRCWGPGSISSRCARPAASATWRARRSARFRNVGGRGNVVADGGVRRCMQVLARVSWSLAWPGLRLPGAAKFRPTADARATPQSLTLPTSGFRLRMLELPCAEEKSVGGDGLLSFTHETLRLIRRGKNPAGRARATMQRCILS